MLRPLLAGLTMSALTAVLYALWCFFVPRQWGLGADAWDVLLLVGIMLSAMGFFAGFIASASSRRLREDIAEIDERNRRPGEIARETANRLNALALAPVCCKTTTDWQPRRIRFDGAGDSAETRGCTLPSSPPRQAPCNAGSGRGRAQLQEDEALKLCQCDTVADSAEQLE
jgi:hypothetical protein